MNRTSIVLLFLAWRVWFFIFTLLGLVLVPLGGKDFFGGGIDNYVNNPLFWSLSNFDGEHYISIAQRGYRTLEHSFFPLYPMLVGFLSTKTIFGIASTGIVLSNIAFLASLFLFWKLVRLDFSAKVALLSQIALVLFPTSFFFGTNYTESLFLLLALGSLLSVRKNRWFLAGIFGLLASLTRIYGVILLPTFIVEWLQQRHEKRLRIFSLKPISFLVCLFLTLSGLLGYVLFLAKTTSNPLSFYTDLSPFGEQRSQGFVLLPQVFFRYAKMVVTIGHTQPISFTIFLELATAIFALLLLVWGFKRKLRLSYLIFAFAGYILPTTTGSFSSFPRYILILFPFFIFFGLLLSERKIFLPIIWFLFSATLLAITSIFFVRGYWVG